ncbi:FUSC family protein [Acidisoma silvae]|uniref:FUSC family protein n=1 Tax=Acidisoma silvae TaxID=2802396 RepID=A0A963YS65_9PROT|nr:FUSC family protein [Acidisoma silvae]MCB8876011.1 FUSC family protein [Acidisoma silvae]
MGIPLYFIYCVGRLDLEVFAAFGALTSLYGHSEPAETRLETQLAVGASLVLTIAAAAIFSAMLGPSWLLALMLLAVVLLAGSLGAVMGWMPRGEIFFVLSLLVIAGLPLKPTELPLVIGTSTGGALISIILTLLEIENSRMAQPWHRRLRQRTAAGTDALDKRRHAIAIMMAAIGVMSAWLLSLALKIGHPYWAALIVTALIPALLSADALRRTGRLALGTAGGVGLAALLFSASPGPLALISVIVICQAIAEVFVARSYAIALLFFTPLAIGMSNIGRGLPWGPLLTTRVVEAGIGIVIALLVIVAGRVALSKWAPGT